MTDGTLLRIAASFNKTFRQKSYPRFRAGRCAMPSEFYRHLRRDLVQSIYDQLLSGDLLTGDGIICVGRAMRSLDSSDGCDWKASFWLSRARASCILAAGTNEQVADLIDQMEAAAAACEHRRHIPRPEVCDEP